MLLKLLHVGQLSASAADVAARAATPVPATFRVVVEQKVLQLVTILKLVCCEEEQLEMMFGIMWQEGTAADLHTIRELKNPTNRLVGAVTGVTDVVVTGVGGMGSGVMALGTGSVNVMENIGSFVSTCDY
jgi:hypothetical protein